MKLIYEAPISSVFSLVPRKIVCVSDPWQGTTEEDWTEDDSD